MSGIDLWSPTHVGLTIDLLTAFLLGIVHGVTPDEHTWPITFSYAVGGYSTRAGLRAGLTFSLAFTVQRALASELAYLGLSRWFAADPIDSLADIAVGALMLAAGLYVLHRRSLPHLHLTRRGRHRHSAPPPDPRPLNPWMPAVHGFVAGWGFGAFALIIYTVLAPGMPSAWWGWVPGALYGLGTTVVQAAAGSLFGWWSGRRGMPQEVVRRIALLTASRTLTWGGVAFVLFGALGVFLPAVANISVTTGLRVHNLHTIGLPFLLVVFTVLIAGVGTLLVETRAWRRRSLAESAAASPPPSLRV